MRIIQFEENQKEVWNKFIAENCSESFLQAWEWGEFQKSLGRKIWRIGVIDNNSLDDDKSENTKYQIPNTKYDLLSVALVVKYDLPLGQSYFYCPRGPVIKISNIKYQISNILDFLFGEIEKIGKEEKSLFLKIDPPTPLTPTLSRGERKHASPFRKGAGGIFKKSLSEVQPRDTLILDITKSEEELLKEMKQKTRYNIRLAGRKGVKISNIKYQISNIKYFEKFWELVEETSRRDKFASHNKDYYWKMLESLNNPESDILECRFQDYSNCRLQARLYFAEYNNKIIAANIVLFFGEMAIYLHGASSNEHRNVMAPYLLQWQQIVDAKKMGCKKYDFWGIAFKSQITNHKSQINSKFSDWGGITKFKKGFGGHEKNYIGAYDLVFNNIGYPIYRFMRKTKGILRFVK